MPKQISSNQALGILAVGAFSLALAGCQHPRLAETELEAVQTASDVYRAYERGDCRTVSRLTGEEQLAAWDRTELRYSLTLAKAFCLEREGDQSGAIATYQMLKEKAQNTFAAADALERMRTLRALDTDPEYRRWVEEAIATAKPNLQSRTPVSRIPADFPPAARAAGIEGFTVVEFSVTPDGLTQNPLVVASNPPLLFDGASLRAVRQWQFMQEPDTQDSPRQVIRILFRSNSGITLEDAQRLTE